MNENVLLLAWIFKVSVPSCEQTDSSLDDLKITRAEIGLGKCFSMRRRKYITQILHYRNSQLTGHFTAIVTLPQLFTLRSWTFTATDHFGLSQRCWKSDNLPLMAAKMHFILWYFYNLWMRLLLAGTNWIENQKKA